MSDTITIRVSSFASGCLRGVLCERIADVERHRRVAGHLYTQEGAEATETVLRQMRECLTAVEDARLAYVGLTRDDPRAKVLLA